VALDYAWKRQVINDAGKNLQQKEEIGGGEK